jgi:ADP-heptose:LPS heptosyltransferase
MRDPALLIRSGALGDFVLTLPLLRALRAAGRRVCLLTRASYADLVRGSGLVDEVADLESAGLHRLGRDPPPRLRGWLQGAELYCFGTGQADALAPAARACGATRVRALEARPVAPPHVSVRMVRDAGLTPSPDLLRDPPLARSGRGEGVLWLHPGSGSPAKNAPLERFVALAQEWPGRVVVSLGEAERSELARYRAAFGREVEIAHDLELDELRERIEREARAFAGNDSGPAHLAAALGVPTLAIFVSTDPAIWRPVGPQVQTATDPGELCAATLLDLCDGAA